MMTIPNLSPSGLDLVAANQLAVETICSWRSAYNPQFELKVTNDGESIRYSVYNHHRGVRCYWPSSPSSSTLFTSVFTHCVWKSSGRVEESRLFNHRSMAVLVSLSVLKKTIGIKEWIDDFSEEFLIKNNPIVSNINDDHSLEFQKEIRTSPRNAPYDPEAEEGITRWRRTRKGELVLIEEEPVIEETMKVWFGPRDIRLIKFISGRREEILCKVFNWETKEDAEIYSKFAPDADPKNLPCTNRELNIEEMLQYVQGCIPELKNIKKKEAITFYREHPLNYFMPNHALSRTEASKVETWVYEQFYRKEGENEQPFEYTNFVSAKKIAFSFSQKYTQKQDKMEVSSKIESWHVEMKRQAAWALQFPIGISHFFAGIFLASVQNPTPVDEDAMERLMRGVPLFDVERNQITDDFAVELGACSTIHFYIACDRSISQLEIDGRVWVRRFANAGRDVRGAVVHGAEGLVHAVGSVDLAKANRAIRNAADVVESVTILRQGLQGLPPPQKTSQEKDKNI